MTKRMLIDAAHAEETRVVVIDGSRIEELDFESSSKRQLRGNIYLAKVTRVEPSLQAAFIEYGGNRHGFLAFNEIHPDYYQIPVADREALMRDAAEEDDHDEPHTASGDDDDDDMDAEVERRRRRLMRRYKIQEVIKRRQIMLVQVVKEERGNKGAALTTYLSLAGRYGVLMPNTARGGGISRKITNAADRRRLKSAVASLDVPQGMGLIVRTAGAARTKAEIKRDYEYLLRLWENIRDTTMKSIAPALIYEEEDLVKRAIRDMFDKDLETIEVEGEAGYREARDFMRMIMPAQAKKIIHYRESTPLFVHHNVEDQIAQIHSPVVQLRSGGYLVINQTEALVAVDVNSGRATRERNIEATALKTNMEAAEEAARQLRLRDLAGLIVIDFIDMDEAKNNRAVEKKLSDCLKDDRARIQMGKISGFGLMEISRQRRRSGVLEGSTHVCEHCQGTGRVRSVESSALAALRAIEMEAGKGGAGAITVRLPAAVALYVLNEKRAYLAGLDDGHGLHVTIALDNALAAAEHAIERTETREDYVPKAPPAPALPEPEWTPPEDFDDEEEIEAEASEGDEAAPRADREDDGEGRGGRNRGRRRRRGGRAEGDEAVARAPAAEGEEAETDEEGDEDGEGETNADGSPGSAHDDDKSGRRRRRRGRRGGRKVRDDAPEGDAYAWKHPHGGFDTPHPADDPYAWRDPHAPRVRIPIPGSEVAAVGAGGEAAPGIAADEQSPVADTSGRPPRRRRRKTSGGPDIGTELETVTDLPVEAVAAPAPAAPETVEAPAKRARARRKPAAEVETLPTPEVSPVVLAAPATEDLAPAKPARARRAKAAPPVAETVTAPAAAPEPEALAVVEPSTPELAVVALVAPALPDPSEIKAPPEKPKGGWWRLKR